MVIPRNNSKRTRHLYLLSTAATWESNRRSMWLLNIIKMTIYFQNNQLLTNWSNIGKMIKYWQNDQILANHTILTKWSNDDQVIKLWQNDQVMTKWSSYDQMIKLWPNGQIIEVLQMVIFCHLHVVVVTKWSLGRRCCMYKKKA